MKLALFRIFAIFRRKRDVHVPLRVAIDSKFFQVIYTNNKTNGARFIRDTILLFAQIYCLLLLSDLPQLFAQRHKLYDNIIAQILHYKL